MEACSMTRAGTTLAPFGGHISRLPVSLRIILESVVRNLGDHRTGDQDVEAGSVATERIPHG
jgi:hypothetical protein